MRMCMSVHVSVCTGVYLCICVYLYMHVCVCEYVHVQAQRTTSVVFLSYHASCFYEMGISH